ncbi:MAG: hypothetical protein HQL91_05950 [Magnetococcales bacterium]|nr:hypothetical protein [Magnetococcales bacterium]
MKKTIWIIALRGMRGARRDFLLLGLAILLIVALATGMAATAHILRTGIDLETRSMLAADLRLESATPFPESIQSLLRRPDWQVAENLEFTAMVRLPDSERTVLVEVLAAAPEHPLRGTIDLRSGRSAQAALQNDGAILEPALFDRLGITPDAWFQLGQARFHAADTLVREPDRVLRFFRWGPRLIIPKARAQETGLLGFGSRIQYVALIRLPAGEDPATLAKTLEQTTLGLGIRVLTPAEGQPSARRFIDRFTIFLHFLTLLTLLTATQAISDAMAAHARENRTQIAILKSLGASHGTVMAILLTRMLIMAVPGAVAGSALGTSLPWLIGGASSGQMPWLLSLFLIGAGAGSGLGVFFSLGALWSTRQVSPATLFRAIAWEGGSGLLAWPWRWGIPLGVTLLLTFLLGLQAGWKSGLLFCTGLIAGFALLGLLAKGGVAALRRWHPASPTWRLAVRALTAPDSGTSHAIFAVGLGIGVLCAILLVEQNLDHQMVARLPTRMPGFFLIDLQPDQEAPLRQLASRFALTGDDLRVTPVVRGRLQALKGVAVTPEMVQTHPQAWRFQRDYVMTWAQTLPPGNHLTAGQWWQDPQAREASVEREMAKALGLDLGDTLSFDILGETVTAPITSIRELRWSDMGLNFFVVFSPGVLAGAPFSNLASAMVAPEREEAFRTAVVNAFPNVSLIAAREVLQRAREMLDRLIASVRFAGAMAAASGLTALAVTVSLLRRRRAREAAIHRLLGAVRQDLLKRAGVEFLLIGLIAALAGVLAGQGVNAGVMEVLFEDAPEWLPLTTLAALIGGTALVVLTGHLATRQDLGQSIPEALRRTP